MAGRVQHAEAVAEKDKDVVFAAAGAASGHEEPPGGKLGLLACDVCLISSTFLAIQVQAGHRLLCTWALHLVVTYAGLGDFWGFMIH
jgi:hypothetical protein